MRKKSAKAIDDQAVALLRKFALLNVPVDVIAVADRLGAKVVFEDLEDDVSGFLLREKGVSTIAVNKLHHRNRQRFTIAHECGHLHLHGDWGDRLWVDKTYFFRDQRASAGDHFAEVEANRFAAGLLMPEDQLRTIQGVDKPVSELDIVRLALRFDVSERAMTLRLISLELIESVAA